MPPVNEAAVTEYEMPRTGWAPGPNASPYEEQMVYVAAHRGYIKIGTSKSVNRRLAQLAGEYSGRFELLATFYGGRELEGLLHRHFLDQNVRCGNEFFFRDGALAEWVDAGCPDDLTRRLWKV